MSMIVSFHLAYVCSFRVVLQLVLSAVPARPFVLLLPLLMLQDLLTRHKPMVASYLSRNYDQASQPLLGGENPAVYSGCHLLLQHCSCLSSTQICSYGL